VVEGLAVLARWGDVAALSPQAEYVVANGPWCVYSQHLFRTSAGIAAAAGGDWDRAEKHHRIAIDQAGSAPYRTAQPLARYWYADMLLTRGENGDRERAIELLGEALQLCQAVGMTWHGQHTWRRLSALTPDATASYRPAEP